MDERQYAINQYAIEEETAVDGKKAVVLVAVDNIRNLKEAYPSYFLDTSEFLTVLENIKRNCLEMGWVDWAIRFNQRIAKILWMVRPLTSIYSSSPDIIIPAKNV